MGIQLQIAEQTTQLFNEQQDESISIGGLVRCYTGSTPVWTCPSRSPRATKSTTAAIATAPTAPTATTTTCSSQHKVSY